MTALLAGRKSNIGVRLLTPGRPRPYTWDCRLSPVGAAGGKDACGAYRHSGERRMASRGIAAAPCLDGDHHLLTAPVGEGLQACYQAVRRCTVALCEPL